MLQDSDTSSFHKKNNMRAKKIIKRTLFIFKKNTYQDIKSDPTTSDPTGTGTTSLTGISDLTGCKY